MNTYYDNIEIEPLSLEEPIDWYYNKVAEHGYATECVFLIFSEYMRRHNLVLKICGISFGELKPEMESETLRLEIIETDPDSNYVMLKMRDCPDMPPISSLRVKFDSDIYFSFFETDSNGNLIELDYSDDYEIK